MLQSMDSAWRFPIAATVGLAAGTYIGAVLATLYAIFVFGDGVNTWNVLEPWFLRYSPARIAANPDVRYTIWLITAFPAVVLAGVGINSVQRGRLSSYDDSHFQTRTELKRNKMTAPVERPGFVYAKMTKPQRPGPFVSAEPNRFPHAIMIGPTGRGKGVGFVSPNLLKFGGSAIVLDQKGENFENTAIHRERGLGNRIWYFSPFDYVMPEGADDTTPVYTRTHRFNPLARIAALPSWEQQYTAINAMADLFLIVESVNAQSFFQAGRSLFVGACLYAIEKGRPTIGEALRLMTGGGSKKDSYVAIAESTSNPTVAEIFLTMADETDKILDSYVSVIRGAGLELWLDPAVDRATSESDFDFSTFRSEPQSLYIVVQPEHLKTLAPLIRLLFADAIASLQRKLPGPDEPHPVMFLMDEFDQLGRQPMVLNSIKTIRQYGGRFFIITQSIPGLESIYGETDRRALLAGAGVQIYMTPQDDRTAQVLSDALGKRTTVSTTRSQSVIRKFDESGNVSRRSEERPLISPAEILRFPLDRVLVLPEGQYPILAHHIRYFEDHHFECIYAARAGHDLPYPPLTEPTKRAKKIVAVAPAETKPLTQEQMVSGLAEQQSGYAGLAGQAEQKQRPTPSASAGRAAPAKRDGAHTAKKIAAEFGDFAHDAEESGTPNTSGASRSTPTVGQGRRAPLKRADAPSAATIAATFEAEGQRGSSRDTLNDSRSADGATGGEPARPAGTRSRPKRIAGSS
ncbi:type IV secretion system protein VirD4 [Palleronia aestuarii]|uniref:Type IV secretion system protein VirD4 n=1 Tax=Palleronia aestuarii TaxID=568105 RepID=A0A2W7NMJ3_9RHOB|nr:type IV secretory system conjugative DNA transfer family protein [Palleronia aestuarii]PZX12492.1 type IV secretion system protein VirD4 [Palleronia aestuarii]